MKTSHQLARELLAGPDLPIWHFDPSRAGGDEESDTALSEPTIERDSGIEGLTPGEISAMIEDAIYTGEFITICGDMDPHGERGTTFPCWEAEAETGTSGGPHEIKAHVDQRAIPTDGEKRIVEIYHDLMGDPDLKLPFIVSIPREIELDGGLLIKIELHKRLEANEGRIGKTQ